MDTTYGRRHYLAPDGHAIAFISLAPDGKLQLVVDDFALPNGLAFSPDESRLYINDSARQHMAAALPDLVGEPEAIRACLEGRAVVPVSDCAKAKIIVSREERTTCGDDGLTLLYPEIATHHAVVNRMKDGPAVR